MSKERCIHVHAHVRKPAHWTAIAFAGLLAAASSSAFDLASLPAYKPREAVEGTIRIWGNNEQKTLFKFWEKGFQKHQPNVRFNEFLPSSACSLGFLYAGVADLAPMGREAWQLEQMGFFQVFKSLPVEIICSSGSFDVQDKTWCPVVFLPKANPISKFTLKQLDGIFGAPRTGGWWGVFWHPEVARTAKDDIRTWGQMGLTGDWADKEIQCYGYDLQFSGTRFTFERIVFKGGDKWNPNLREYVGSDRLADPTMRTRGGEQSVADVAKDKYGIGYSGAQYVRKHPDLKIAAIAERDGGPYVMPSAETCQNRSYALERDMYIYLHRDGQKPLEPRLREFLHYVLSRDGQQDVVDEKDYLPLTAELAQAQLKKID